MKIIIHLIQILVFSCYLILFNFDFGHELRFEGNFIMFKMVQNLLPQSEGWIKRQRFDHSQLGFCSVLGQILLETASLILDFLLRHPIRVNRIVSNCSQLLVFEILVFTHFLRFKSQFWHVLSVMTSRKQTCMLYGFVITPRWLEVRGKPLVTL